MRNRTILKCVLALFYCSRTSAAGLPLISLMVLYTSILADFQKKGFIELFINPKNRKEKLISLTGKGLSFLPPSRTAAQT